MPRLSPPSVGAEAPRAAEPTAPDRKVAVGFYGEYVPTVTASAVWCVKRPGDFDLWLLTLRVVSESRVTWATSVPILAFRGLSVLDLGPMYATDRQTDVRQRRRLMHQPIRGLIWYGILEFNVPLDTV